jgi:hypothetical protein
MFACLSGSLEVVKMLIQKCGNKEEKIQLLSMKNTKEKSVFDYAKNPQNIREV